MLGRSVHHQLQGKRTLVTVRACNMITTLQPNGSCVSSARSKDLPFLPVSPTDPTPTPTSLDGNTVLLGNATKQIKREKRFSLFACQSINYLFIYLKRVFANHGSTYCYFGKYEKPQGY
jgi:hypothetical protein